MDKVLKLLNSSKSFYKVFNDVNIISVKNGYCLASLKVNKSHTNAIGELHGGCSASLVDLMSTACIKTVIGEEEKYDSKGINLIYAKSAKIGQEILIEATIDKKINETIYLSVELKNKKSSEVLLKGTHLIRLT